LTSLTGDPGNSRRSAVALAVLAAVALSSGCTAQETAAASPAVTFTATTTAEENGRITKVVEIYWQGGG
jgi:hypothetical protein